MPKKRKFNRKFRKFVNLNDKQKKESILLRNVLGTSNIAEQTRNRHAKNILRLTEEITAISTIRFIRKYEEIVKKRSQKNKKAA